ncbi:hypothetical protein CRYUN_Cryun06bG0112300 [Craigia yunnanensis]
MNIQCKVLISACAGVGALSLGAWAHTCLLKNSSVDVLINNSLVNLYCKCGSLELSQQVFDGFIDEALNLVSMMPMRPDVIWRSLLDACSKKNGSTEISEELARQVIESGDIGSGDYVLLSRVYASASRWDDVGLGAYLTLKLKNIPDAKCN